MGKDSPKQSVWCVHHCSTYTPYLHTGDVQYVFVKCMPDMKGAASPQLRKDITDVAESGTTTQ